MMIEQIKSSVNIRRVVIFFFQAEDGIRDIGVTGVQTCALPIYRLAVAPKHEMETSPVHYVLWSNRQAVEYGDPKFGVDYNQIGRASCRERVYITVVRESFKKEIYIYNRK